MRLRFRLLGLAAAAGALGTGCEFWSNLTGDKTADRADLEVTVRDAFTGAPMPGVSCTLVVDSRAAESDAEGHIRWEAVPTGPGKVRCGEALYHPAEADVGVRRAGGATTVEMARLGGASWYDEDSLRVGFEVKDEDGGRRYPGGKTLLKAFPSRSDRVLEYHWTRTAAQARPPLSPTQVPEVRLWHDNLGSGEVDDTLTLRVVAKLAGRDAYEIGTASQVVHLHPNKKPIITVSDAFWTGTPNMSNCRERRTAPLVFTALDPDGRCVGIRLYSRDQFSPLGNFDTTLACDTPIHGKFFNLVNWPQGDSQQPLSNSLFIEVKDDNSVDSTLELRFTVTPNALPELALSALDGEEALFAMEPLRFRLSVKDANNPVAKVDVDWQDGETSTFRPEPGRGANQADTTLSHVYASPGTYAIGARTRDACGGAGSVQLSVTVQPARAATAP